MPLSVDRVSLQRSFNTTEKNPIVGRTTCGPTPGQDTPHQIRKCHRPVKRLDGAHGPASHQLDLSDTIFLDQQTMLTQNKRRMVRAVAVNAYENLYKEVDAKRAEFQEQVADKKAMLEVLQSQRYFP